MLLLVTHHLDPVTIDHHISQILLFDLQMRHLLLGLSHLLRILIMMLALRRFLIVLRAVAIATKVLVLNIHCLLALGAFW